MIFTNFEYFKYWPDVWKSKMSGGGGNNKRFQYCIDPSGQEILYFRALQGHSGRNPIDSSLQDKLLIPNNFSEPFIILDVRSVYTPSQVEDWKREDKNSSRADRRYSWQPWIPCIRMIKIQLSLIWPNHVLNLTRKSVKCTKIHCIGSIYSLLNGKDWSSIKQDRTQSSSTIHSQLIESRKQLW